MTKNILILFFLVPLRLHTIEINQDIIAIALQFARLTYLVSSLRDRISERTITQWYKDAATKDPADENPIHIVTLQQYEKALRNYIKMQEAFLHKTAWLNYRTISFDDKTLYNDGIVQPFVLKYEAYHDTEFFFFGDSHGDIQALSRSLYKLYQDGIISDNLHIKNPKTVFFFLGDLTDRGAYGPDLLVLLFQFALTNPSQVFITRGNHEDFEVIKRYGFYEQLKNLYKKETSGEELKDSDPLFDNVVRFFNLLPVAAFIGCNGNYFQCCHGGLEPRYNPGNILVDPRKIILEYIQQLSLSNNPTVPFNKPKSLEIDTTSLNPWMEELTSPVMPFDLGFIWYDFNASAPYKTSYKENRGLTLGRKLTEALLESYSHTPFQVRGIIRAHQHNDSMPGLFEAGNFGVYSLWNNQVLTTIGTGIYTESPAFIQLFVRNDFTEWRLSSYNFPLALQKWQNYSSYLDLWKNKAEVYPIPAAGPSRPPHQPQTDRGNSSWTRTVQGDVTEYKLG